MVDWIKLAKAVAITFGLMSLLLGFVALVLYYPIVIGIITILALMCFLVYLVYIEL